MKYKKYRLGEKVRVYDMLFGSVGAKGVIVGNPHPNTYTVKDNIGRNSGWTVTVLACQLRRLKRKESKIKHWEVTGEKSGHVYNYVEQHTTKGEIEITMFRSMDRCWSDSQKGLMLATCESETYLEPRIVFEDAATTYEKTLFLHFCMKIIPNAMESYTARRGTEKVVF